jgi:hypothetical protein
MRTIRNFVVILTAAAVISGCKPLDNPAPDLDSVTGVTVKDGDAAVGNSFALDVNQEKTLTVSLNPAGVPAAVTWNSSDPAVLLTPSGDGRSAVIKGIIDGASSVITVSASNEFNTSPAAKIFTVTVDQSAFHPIAGLSIRDLGADVGETITLALHEQRSLAVSMAPAGIRGSVTWECSDPAVKLTPAKDSFSAEILGITTGGTASITVSASNTVNTSAVTKTFTVTVGASLIGPFYVSSLNGSDLNSGTAASPFKTISKAAGVAQPGDTINVMEGIYRERVSPPRGGTEGFPIKYLAENGRRVFIKGSDVYEGPWGTGVSGSSTADLNLMQFTDDCYRDDANPFKVKAILMAQTPLTLGQVFVEGIPYTQAASSGSLAAGTWWYEASTNKVHIKFSPGHSTLSLVEITTRRRIFAPHATTMALGYIHIEGFIMEHCGNQFPKFSGVSMQAGALGFQSGHHWVVRNNVVRYAANAGIDCGFMNSTNEREMMAGWNWFPPGIIGNLIENNYIVDNGSVGICGTGAYQMIFRNNVVMWNHTQGYPLENSEQAGVKFHGMRNSLIENNYIAENFAFGMWLDNQFIEGRVTGNVFVGNLDRGIALEMSAYAFTGGQLVDHNIIMNNGTTGLDTQIDITDGSGSTFVNNLIAGGKYGVTIQLLYGGDSRRVDNNAFYNNIFTGNTSAAYTVPYPIAMATGGQRFLGNLYDADGRRWFINNRTDQGGSPLAESDFRSNVAADAGTTVSALSSAGALADNVVKLNLAEWQTFWSKTGRTIHNDSDAEVMTGVTAVYNAAAKTVTLTLPAAVTKRDNTRWDAPYRDLYELTEDSSYPGPFTDLRTVTHTYQVWQGLPVLERGALPW